MEREVVEDGSREARRSLSRWNCQTCNQRAASKAEEKAPLPEACA